MCCGGTVARICGASARAARAAALSALLAQTLPQVFGFAFGVPVEPEVKPIATRWSAGIERLQKNALSAPPIASGTCT